ncbi:MAG: copper resistance system multicopper oxidase [Gammaproteobacteria bacterium]|nr:copper resistance system multicopper oxidase [Gammaproteobacteria bacterium]
MKRHQYISPVSEILNHSRRRFVQGLTAGGVLAGLGLLELPAWAAPEATQAGGRRQVLRGTEFDLEIGELPVNFTGESRLATVVNGQLPAPELRWREGDTVTLRVTNKLKHHTSIHWHGIILPNAMDGVPGLTFGGIAPGETFTYRFKVGQSGTYWYHSHSGFQEQTGLYGPIVIEPRARDPFHSDREYVVMLSDWTDDSPDFVYSRLKKMDGYYNYAKLTLGDFIDDAKKRGLSAAWAEKSMWDQMRMSARDLADVSAATYTYLMNGTTPAGNWTGLFKRGEKVRLRFINGSAMSFFDVRIPGMNVTVVAADGLNVHPVTVEEFRIGVAETYDVIVEPKDDRAYTIFAQSADRSGYARGTLAPHTGMQADIPALDPVPTLTMADMGMSMQGMHGMDHGSQTDMKGESKKAAPAMKCGGGMVMDHGSMGGSKDKDMGGGMMTVKHHAATEFGPGTDMHADEVSTRLDDPGVGLRNNGRRVLTYADLKSLDNWLDPREPSQTLEIHLTGSMERYMWSFNGVKFSDADPIQLKYGERVRILLVNDTMMEHPIHLHGLWSEVETPDGKFQVRKHTVNVKPGHAISYRVLADARGRWAYHCHLLYHMMAGMFREVRVV